MAVFGISCPCHFGLESVLASEAKKCGFADVVAENGRVNFKGGFEEVARANISLRTAERVQIEMGRFNAFSFEDLFEKTNALPFEDFISEKSEFPVTGYSINSKLSSVPDCQSIIKKAVVKRLQSVYKSTWFEETGPKIRIQFGIIKNEVRVFLDTSGVGLHKRGYRRMSTEAPIKETLAAGIVNLARIHPNSEVYDPFCGSGTLLIEAALAALSIAPGINRKFQFEEWDCVDKRFIKTERERAVDLVNLDANFQGFGYDIDEEAIKLSQQNSEKAGVASRITLKNQSIQTFEAPTKRATILTNPPYGERLLDLQEAVKLYRIMGDVFAPNEGVNYYIISSYEDFEQAFSRPADKRRKLYNGPIKCNLYMYFR